MYRLTLWFYAFVCHALIIGCSSNTGTHTAEDSAMPLALPPNLEESFPTVDNIYETGLLKDEPGFVGSELGATVQSVIVDENNELKTIIIVIPDVTYEIDALEVVDKNNKTLPVERESQIIRDYENNNVGIKLFVSPKRNINFRLRLSNEVNGIF